MTETRPRRRRRWVVPALLLVGAGALVARRSAARPADDVWAPATRPAARPVVPAVGTAAAVSPGPDAMGPAAGDAATVAVAAPADERAIGEPPPAGAPSAGVPSAGVLSDGVPRGGAPAAADASGDDVEATPPAGPSPDETPGSITEQIGGPPASEAGVPGRPPVAPLASAPPAVTASSRPPSPRPRRKAVPPGAAPAGQDGEAPGPEFTIKGNTGSKLFHTPLSPYYVRTKAEVWFRTAEDAEAAGFTAYRPRGSRRA